MINFLPFYGINMVFADSLQNANECMKMLEIASPCAAATGGEETMQLPVLKTAQTRNIGWRGNCVMIPLRKGRNFSSC
jgi:hypothetical protein